MEEYFYIDTTGEQKGPIPPTYFLRLGINKNTLIWKSGLNDWQPAGTVPEVASYLESAPVPPPPPILPPEENPIPASSSKKPSNQLVWSLLSLAFCCLPLGFVAIFYSIKVDKLWEQGAHLEAIKASGNAKLWCILSVILGLVSEFFIGFGGLIDILFKTLILSLF